MELPQAQFALDPCVAKFHDPATTTVLLLRFRTGHFFPEREHRRNFFNTLQSAASLLIPGTTLGLERAAVAVFRLRFVTVGHYAWLFFVVPSLWAQQLAARTQVTICFRLIHERIRGQPVGSGLPCGGIFPWHTAQK